MSVSFVIKRGLYYLTMFCNKLASRSLLTYLRPLNLRTRACVFFRIKSAVWQNL